MKIANGGRKKRGTTKNINFDEQIDGGGGGGIRDGAMKEGREAFSNGCAMVESRGAWSGWRKAELMIFTWGRMDGEMMRRVHGDQ